VVRKAWDAAWYAMDRAGVARMRGLYCLILVELDVLDNRLLDAQQGAP